MATALSICNTGPAPKRSSFATIRSPAFTQETHRMPSKEEGGKTVLGATPEPRAPKGRKPDSLSLATPIDGSLGLDSLDWAAVVVRLEDKTGVDPFQKPVERELRTIEALAVLSGEMLGD